MIENIMPLHWVGQNTSQSLLLAYKTSCKGPRLPPITKIFGHKIFFGPTNIFDKKYFSGKIFLDQKFLLEIFFFTQIFFWTKHFFWSQIFFAFRILQD